MQAQLSVTRPAFRVTRLQLTAGLTLLALAIHLAGLSMRPLWLDESFSSWFSAQSFDYLWHVAPTYEAHPPFYYSLLKLWRGVFGDNAAALRSMSVMFNALTVPVAMAAAFELERQAPSGRPLLRAGMVGFLIACSPMFVVLGQEARPYPLLAFAYSVSILALLRLTRQFADGGPGAWSSWLLFGIGAELTLWAHALGALYAACLALALAPALLKAPLSRDRLLRGVAVAVPVALIYVPCLIMMARRASDWGANWLRWEPDVLLQLFPLYSVPVEVLTVGSAVAAVAMLLLVKRAIMTAIAAKGWNAERAVLLLWFGPPVLAAVISSTFIPVWLARTLAGTIIPAYLAIGGAIARTEARRERMLLAAAICITLLPTAVLTAIRTPSERWDLAAAYLSQNTSAADEVWLYPSDSALPLGDVGRPIAAPMRAIPAPFPTLGVEGPMRAGWPAMVSITAERAAKVVADPRLKQVPTIWLVTRQSGIFDPQNDVPAALSRLRRPGKLEQWGYITIQPYYLRATGR